MAVQPLMPLRPYQEQAIASVRIAVMQADRALLVMPTGSGKTVVFSEICRLAREKKTQGAHPCSPTRTHKTSLRQTQKGWC